MAYDFADGRTGGRVRGKGDLSARTVGHAHRVLGKALGDATKNELVVKNVVAAESAPKVGIKSLRGNRLFTLGMVGLFTGMRLGEVLALRWGRVDLVTICGTPMPVS